MTGTHVVPQRGHASLAAGVFTLAAPAQNAAEGLTIPKGTSVDLVLQDRRGTRTAKWACASPSSGRW
jgi:hypothetical protein